jgi:tRNA pseudouridine55 synthase
MFGFLNLHKPLHWTSRQAVNVLQKLVKPLKVGHAGTLDPIATGVLVVAVGQATRLVEYLQQQSKTYDGTFVLGCRSVSDDIESPLEELVNPPIPTRADIEAMLPRFLGRIAQVPPIFSAVKVGGRRAYDLARRGNEVELAPKWIEIYELQCTSYAYPELKLHMRCGSGTYVRSLGRDLAAALGTAAVMSALVRTSIGPFTLGEAISPEELTRENLAAQLRPSRWGVNHLPSLVLDASEVEAVRHGRYLSRESIPNLPEIVALTATDSVVAILTPHGAQLKPLRVFPPA